MKTYHKLLFILLLITPVLLKAQVNVIPLPRHISPAEGNFTLNAGTRIMYTEDTGMYENALYLKSLLDKPCGYNLKVCKWTLAAEKNSILLSGIPKEADTLGEEGYTLQIAPQSVTIRAKGSTGIFYGIQTLRQLLPAAIESNAQQAGITWTVPCLVIADKPAFGWRGMLLDCCRHFMKKDFIKRYIDLLAYYKMNRLHWHLTEDQGWRIEIKKYPKLTQVGAWRKEADGTVYGGFYTQDDIREVVAYAASRHITIIPEIEMPGHSVAALASYPAYSCTGGPFSVENNWGVFKEIYCAGNDSTFRFLEDILDEVVSLFPSKYIHIGGDEAPKYRWNHCEKCKARMNAINAKDAGELQSYFIRRIEDYLKTKDRRIIGWDEILEGGVAPDATVQSWRGIKGAIAAANSGHDAIVSPTSHAYFDYSVKTTPIDKVYEFDPVPKELNAEARKHILGGECNMWTEYAPQELIDSKMFPRILAMSEVLWTYPSKRDKEVFLSRVRTQYPRLDNLGVKYGYERQAVQFSTGYNEQDKTFTVNLSPGQQGLELHYTTDGSEPDGKSTIYTKPFPLASSAEVKVKVAKNGVLQNEVYSINLTKHKGIGKKITYTDLYVEKYNAGGNTGLLDGIRGSNDYHVCWQGFQKNDMVVMLDMGTKTKISKVTVGCLQSIPSWIFFPQSLELSVSENGTDYRSVSLLSKLDLPKDDVMRTRDFSFTALTDIETRYIRIQVKNIEKCPDWHDAAGSEAWLFVDEIIIE